MTMKTDNIFIFIACNFDNAILTPANGIAEAQYFHLFSYVGTRSRCYRGSFELVKIPNFFLIYLIHIFGDFFSKSILCK